jgi:SAM-dependent methyltransferase
VSGFAGAFSRSSACERIAFLRIAWAGLAFAASVCTSAAAATLDVPTPYLPSTHGNVDEMLRLAAVQPNDLVYDLGSGDGRVVIAAARDWGARGVGIEIDAELVAQSRAEAQRAGVAERTAFHVSDALKADLREATVVTLYLLTPLVNRLQPKLLKELKPGTRIVAHEYGFADWKPDRHVQASKNFYLYVVPAAVGGKWRLSTALPEGVRDYDLDFEQRYQEVKGGARVAGGFLPAFEARLSGERLSFVLIERDVAYRYEGRVAGSLIEGVVRWGAGPKQSQTTWRAVRAGLRGGEE